MMLERVNLMKLKCADQRFGLGYKPKKDDYKWVISYKIEARIEKIEGQKLEKKGVAISPLRTTFPRFVKVIKYGMTDLHISALECQYKEQIEEVKVKAKDEMLSQLSVHTIDEVPTKAFVKKLDKGGAYQNWKMGLAPIMFKK